MIAVDFHCLNVAIPTLVLDPYPRAMRSARVAGSNVR